MSLLEETVAKIEKQDMDSREHAKEHILNLTMPPWALGRLLDLAVDLAGMTRGMTLPVARKNIVLMAGDHGIVKQGVCPNPQSVTTQMIYNFVNRGAGINVLAENAGAKVTVVDMGVASDLSPLVQSGAVLDRKIRGGTSDFTEGPAMTREEAVRSIESGIELVQSLAADTDVFGTGEMGIGNTSPSSAIAAVLSGMDVTPLVGRGAGLDPSRLSHKAAMIRRGIEVNQPDRDDPLDIFSKVGGFEIGGIAGVILGAASLRRPVVVDGFISSAGALIAAAIEPDSRDYMILAHGSAEPGHVVMAKLLDKKPLLDLSMRLGEGTGAALAMNLLDAASAIMNRMATFESAKVTTEGIR